LAIGDFLPKPVKIGLVSQQKTPSQAASAMPIGTAFVKFYSMKKMMIGIAAVALLSSCTQVGGWFGSDTDSTNNNLSSESSNKAMIFRDESITKENAYSDLFLDSAALEHYIQRKNITGDMAQRMREFYLVRNNQFAWFNSNGLTEQARGLWSLRAEDVAKSKDSSAKAIDKTMDSLLSSGSAAMMTDTATLTDSERILRDSAALMDGSTAMTFSTSDSTVVQTELALTEQLVQLAGENKGVVTADNFYWLVPRKKMDAMQLADSVLNKPTDSALYRDHQQYTALKQSLQLYYTAAKQGGWDSLTIKAGLKKGVKSPQVTALKRRLAATGDYPAGDTTNVFTDSLVTALASVQQQYGFAPTGQLNDSLVRELNVPAEQRVRQILVNMNRALWMPRTQVDSSHIMINIPSLQLVVYGDSGKRLEMPVIVGKEGTGTMAFSDEITKVVFNPYWNIPESIVRNEIKPEMDKDPNYLKKKNMEVVRQHDSLPEIRQLPGKDNALGRVKFLFPNSFDIYLHDTPHKNLFAQQNRALSHGCIRVAKPDSLAAFILRGQSEWTPEKIAAAMNSGKEQTVDVKNPVPVSITYYTAWIAPNGKMNFRKDIYGYDQKTAAQMFTGAATSTAKQI
jgi:L,D-transpeptidase YcbB